MKSLILVPALAAAAMLSGCVETASVPESGNSVEAQARANCAAAVRGQTGNPDVSVLSSDFSEAGTRVVLRVGPTGTWECFGYTDGSTGGIMSLTNEGAA
jgi:hypothetical protein